MKTMIGAVCVHIWLDKNSTSCPARESCVGGLIVGVGGVVSTVNLASNVRFKRAKPRALPDE